MQQRIYLLFPLLLQIERFFYSKNSNFEIYLINDFEIDDSIMNVANLSIYGWKKEAIPTTKIKKSLITRIFKSIFE